MPVTTRSLLFFTVILLSACGQGSNSRTSRTDSSTTTVKDNGMGSYQKYLATLDTTNAANAPLAAAKYNTLFGGNDTIINDLGYVLFEHYYYSLMLGLNDRYGQDTVDLTPLDTINLDDLSKYPPRLRPMAEDLRRNGFRFLAMEGMAIVAQDRTFITKWFYPHVSGTMKAYLEERLKENEEPFEDDAAILATPQRLAELAVWWDDFTTRYPRFTLSTEAAQTNKYYTTCLLRGMNNTPVLDHDTRSISNYFKEAYEHVLRKYPASGTAKLVRPYYDALIAYNDKKAGEIIAQYKTGDLLLW